MRSFTILIGFYVICLISPSNQRIIEDKSNSFTDSSTDGATNNIRKTNNEVTKTVTYIRASTPARILECVRKFSILRCTKLFVIQKLEGRKVYPRSGNLTKDFLDQFFGDDGNDMGSLVDGKLSHASDIELTQRVVWNFKRFFKNRNIQLRFLPGVMVKIVPSKENKIKFSMKKSKRRHIQDIVSGRAKAGGGTKKKNKKKKDEFSYKDTMIQMAIPVIVMPAVLLGTVLPFVLPALKIATIMSTIMNNSAFLAALIYAARTHAFNNDNEPQHVSYAHYGPSDFN